MHHLIASWYTSVRGRSLRRDAMSAQLPQPVARHPGSEADLGPFLNVITWVLMITSGLAVLTRLITKRALRRRIDIDDGFVVGALVLFASSSFTMIAHFFS